jgi:RNA polymerase sigma-70 factor (ECF subfamily)
MRPYGVIRTKAHRKQMTHAERQPDQVVGQFEAFYRERFRPTVALVYALTGNRWAAEDLAQEAFLRAHRDWTHIRALASPAAWVRRVAVNLAMSRFRRMRSEAAAKLKLSPVPATFQPPTAEHDAFWAEVRLLPRRQSQVIALRYVEDLSTRQIAEALEVAEGTVRALLTQARDRLARQLEAKGWSHG